MAEKPIKMPLPADLPEDWNIGQTVAPDGTTVGLTEQHGYNYLMAAVNRTQEAVNKVNDAFETVSGKRTCRFVVGTSTAGWTEADCDFLCDGTDDQIEIQQAIDALPKNGGEIVLLDGTYQLSDELLITNLSGNVALTGNPGSTTISGGKLTIGSLIGGLFSSFFKCFIEGISFNGSKVSANEISLLVRNSGFIDTTISFVQQRVDRTCIFLCNENEFQQSRNAAAIEVSLTNQTVSPPGLCIISNNIIDVKAASTSTVVSITTASIETVMYTIAGNTITCSERSEIRVNTSGSIIGNSLSNCDINDYEGCAIVGNRLLGCNIFTDAVKLNASTADRGAAVSGNDIKNGMISAAGNITITGNSVLIVSDDTIKSAIRLFRAASNVAEDQFPAVVGNYVAGGQCGILLDEPGSTSANKTCTSAMVNSNRIYGSQTPIKISRYWSGCMVTDNLFTTGSIEDNGTNNIVRFNSDDPSTGGGSGGGGTAGVTTFNGRSGKVVPGNSDYTAEMVGAIPASAVKEIQSMTQSQYDALATKNATTLYLIKE